MDVMADVAPGAFVTAGGKQSWGAGRPGTSKGEWAAVLLLGQELGLASWWPCLWSSLPSGS